MRAIHAAAALAAILGFAPAGAAEFDDPTWPCVQRKVERLSPGLMWAHPIPGDRAPDPALRAEIDALAARLALRRLPEAELPPLIEAFTEDHGAGANLLGRVFARTFERLDRTRTALIRGIGEFSLHQIALTERIDAARDEMDALMEAQAPDFDRVDALEEQVDWDERIWTDRQRSLTYVCETPVLIERRLYAVAQMLAAAVE